MLPYLCELEFEVMLAELRKVKRRTRANAQGSGTLATQRRGRTMDGYQCA